jgi:hypothetical protein
MRLRRLERRLVRCAAKGEELDCAPKGDVTEGELDEIKDWRSARFVPKSSLHCALEKNLVGPSILGRDFGCVAHT